MTLITLTKQEKLLASYKVDPIRGFLPSQDPLDCLPSYYDQWEQMIRHLPGLLTANRARMALTHLPILRTDYLETNAQLERAMLLLSMFASVNVWADPLPDTTIPHNLAQPLCEVAAKLDRPPILSYTSQVLHNWRQVNGMMAFNHELSEGMAAPPMQDPFISVENFALQHCFWGGVDEQWFYLISIAIEAAGAPALSTLMKAQLAVEFNQNYQLTEALDTVHETLSRVIAILTRMNEKCAPYIFYHRIRQFIAGWPEEGVIYEGVSEKPQKFVGSSAAQSPLIQAIDAGLDITHIDAKSAYLHKVRPYMQREHRHFIQMLESGPSIRNYVTDNQERYPALRESYNACVSDLDQFRKKHMEIAARYITQQAPKDSKQAELGTGGTSFTQFLSHVRKETKQHMVLQPV